VYLLELRGSTTPKEGTPSMDPRTAATRVPDPDAVEFIRYCYRRRRVGWPELYDEMCAVASRGLFRGYGPEDLATHGIGFSLDHMPSLATVAARIVAEEQLARRPVSVTFKSEPADPPTAESSASGNDPARRFVALPAGA
jgi:hypothetical protein